MWFGQTFGTGSVDFEKRCKMRIRVGMGVILLGLLSIGVCSISQGISQAMVQMYVWFGIGLVVGGIVKVRKNHKILKNPDLKKASAISEMDERNQAIGIRCWAYSGYTMFLLLYLGILASGFVSATLAWVLLTVSGVYGLLLILFRMILQRRM